MDVHQGFNTGAIKKPSVGHRCFFKLVLSIDLVNDFKYDLLHHERRRFGQIDPMVQIHALGLLRVPDFLRDRPTHLLVDLNVAEFQLLVDLVEILAV